MRLIGYIRVSTDEQARDGQSLAIQDMQLQRYCELHGHDLIDVLVDDGVSATIDIDRRPAGSQLIERLLDKEADGFVVQRLDRAFRVTIDGIQTIERFNKRELTIHSVNEHIDTTSAFGKFVLRSLLSMNELERDKISERAKEVNEGLREQCKAWGPTPFGCVRVGDHIYRDPDTWGIREQIVAWRQEGDNKLSLRTICAELQARKVPSPTGRVLWHVSTLQGIVSSHHDLKHIPALQKNNDTQDSFNNVSHLSRT